MSKLAELLVDLCSDGVSMSLVRDVFSAVQLPAKIKRSQYSDGTKYPIVDQGQSFICGYTDDEKALLPDGQYVVFGDHTRALKWVDFRFAAGADGTKVLKSAPEVLPKFGFYALSSLNIPSRGYNRHWTILRDLKIPVPSLEVQQEIVRVLDAFTDLEQSLVSELELRKKQYVEYRDTAIEDLVNGNVPSVHLGDHARTVNGLTGKNKSDFSDGNAKFITYRNVFSNPEVNLETNDYVKVAEGEKQNQVELGDVIFTGSSESREEVGFSAVVTQTPAEPIYLNSFCFVVRFEDPEFIDPGFAKHMFRSRPIRKQIMKAANGVTRINISKPRFMRVEIPVPPMEMQQEIAVKLDAFSSLILSIEQEISLRRQQYEFYRDELLSFALKED